MPAKSEHRRAVTASNSSAERIPVFRDILCAVDGTLGSTAALKLAASLAGPDGHLTLLAVTAVQGAGAYETAAISPTRAERLLKRAKLIADRAGVPSTTAIDPRAPAQEVILERAAEHDLLAIGPPATSRLTGMIVGSVTAAALGRFTRPMLVARRPFVLSLQGRQILVASDGEEGSERLVELAARLGRSQGAPVSLVNALGAESKMNPRTIQAQARALPDPEPYIEPGKASDVILNAAKSRKAALVVVGSRRLGGVRALGSVSRRVVYHAPCAVLVVPPAA
ncbi:MAG: universal stress protein [Solirubrobacteraceae bacterium]